MNLQILRLVVLLIGVAGQGDSMPTVELNYRGHGQLARTEQTALYSAALRLLESSNFNSEQHQSILKTTPAQIHADYRKTVAGQYLLVSSDTPERIRTVGGDVVVVEIVIGLNRPDYADALFTISADGRVVEHGKYSGGICIELLNQVRALRPAD